MPRPDSPGASSAGRSSPPVEPAPRRSYRSRVRNSIDKSMNDLRDSLRWKKEAEFTRKKLEQFNALAEFRNEVHQKHSPTSLRKSRRLELSRGRAYLRPGEQRNHPDEDAKVVPEDIPSPDDARQEKVKAKWRDAIAKTIHVKKMIVAEQGDTNYSKNETVPCLMIGPSNRYLSLWRFYMVICLAWVALLLPVDLCFDLSAGNAYSTVEMVVDISFWVDLVSCFFIGYSTYDTDRDTYRIEYRPSKVATSYLKSWFPIDLVACLSSLDSLALNSGEALKLARMPRLLRLLRMVRLLRLLKLAKIKAEMRDARRVSFLGDIESMFASGIAQVLKIFIVMMVAAHWIGSIWYLIAAFNWRFGKYREEDCEAQGDSWVLSSELCDVQSDTKLYLFSIYWAFSTLTTVGYGDVAATNEWEVVFSLFMMMFGVAFYSMIAGSVVSVISKFNSSIKEMEEKRQNLAKFCRDNELPSELTNKLTSHLEFTFHKANAKSNKSYELDSLLEDLGPQLRTETMLCVFKDLISSLRFFDNKSDEFTVRCVTDLKLRIAYPSDTIFKAGDRAGAMYFVSKGKAFVLSNLDNRTEHVLATLGPGEYFGEIGCLLNRSRQNTIIAATLVEMYSLDRKKVLEIMAEFPEWADEVRAKALDRVKEHGSEDTDIEGLTSPSRLTPNGLEPLDKSASFTVATSKGIAGPTPDESTAIAIAKLSTNFRVTFQELAASNKAQHDRFQDQLERMERLQLSTIKQVNGLQLSSGLAPAIAESEAEMLWAKDVPLKSSRSNGASLSFAPEPDSAASVPLELKDHHVER